MGLLACGAALALASCGDDEEPERVTPAQWEEEATRLCAQHGEVLARAYTEQVPDSDAGEAAFYTADFVPRARAVVRRLVELGFPPEDEEVYRAALGRVIDALAELEAAPHQYIDDRHRGIDPDDDLLVYVEEGFAAADVPC